MSGQGSIDLSGMSVPELRELMASAEARIEEVQAEARRSMRSKMEEMAASAGMTIDEIFAMRITAKPTRKPRKAAVRPATGSAEPKYRSPATGETWTGRGRPPEWMKGMDKAAREKFRI
ncbi:H-NS histone family protein [Roseomonas frigidaquae]|uniref:H-NS histone family protein n=1 Tax=Falsiroseomonas frigidaquae TaxID=487318 RepID=A0ABX1F8C3_9PROT|nr:H-NS histone family protein [Falsiroseomonas frigidaquae]NKE48635.1 H-NS histone family protein [Falsiroseomonas frigidaquae]